VTKPGFSFFCLFHISYVSAFAFVLSDLVFQYLAKRLAGKNVSRMT